MKFKNVWKNIFLRNAKKGGALDLNVTLNSHSKPIDLMAYKTLKNTCYDMMLERWAIEAMDDSFLKSSSLSVWWRRFHIFTSNHPDYFPPARSRNDIDKKTKVG